MTIRCTTCGYYRELKAPGRIKVDIVCNCGGAYERITHIGNGVYKNAALDLFKLNITNTTKL